MRTWDTVAIIGVGLIGGSIGLALRHRQLARQVIGIGHRPASLRTARRRGAVTRTTTDLSAGVFEAELIVVCSPVERIAEHALAAAMACRENAFITDAGSTKEEIVVSVEGALARHNPRQAVFLGSHPMAGSEKKGVQHAMDDLFQGCVTIVTPTAQTSLKTCRVITQFWRSLGAKVVQLDAQEHDKSVAAISHLPHLVASAVAASTPPDSLPLAAGGWRDVTRVAAGDPHLWRQILSQNRLHVLAALDQLIRELAEYRRALTYGDVSRIEQLLEQGKKVRSKFAERLGNSQRVRR